MPDYDSRRADPYPYPTAQEVYAAPGDPIIKATRNIAVRKIQGIGRRGFLLGENDHSPMVSGLAEFVTEVRKLIDAIAPADLSGTLLEQVDTVNGMMLYHGCPDELDDAPLG